MPALPGSLPRASLLTALTLNIAASTFAEAQRTEAASSAIQYVVLEGGGPDQGPGRDVDANMTEMARRFGAMPTSSDRMVAYGVQQLRILSRSADVVRQDVELALDLAERTGVPVFLHVDSCYGWGADNETRPEESPPFRFWQHPEMREWDRFPAGDQLPERVPRQWINWGPWCSPAPAVPAFGSQAFVEFAASQLDSGVLTPVCSRLAEWRSSDREHLFAGINIGWEAHIPDYGDPATLRSIERAGGVVRAEYPRSARGVTMDQKFIGKQL